MELETLSSGQSTDLAANGPFWQPRFGAFYRIPRHCAQSWLLPFFIP
jgi:hypothetical protein